MATSKAVKTGTSVVVSFAAQQAAKRVLGGAAISVLGCSVGAPLLVGLAAGFAVDGLFKLFSD